MNRPHLLVEERDACAIIAFVDKRGRATHANIVKTIDALKKMAHRSGDINSEGDGCGILTDIPRSIWGQRLEDAGLSRHLSESRGFFVGHFFLPMDAPAQTGELKERLRAILTDSGAETLLEVDDQMHAAELGPMARTEAPLFLQICGLVRDDNRQEGGKRLFNIQMELERALPIIALTTNVMAGDRERCLEAGMNDHLGKPVDTGALFAALVKWKTANPS